MMPLPGDLTQEVGILLHPPQPSESLLPWDKPYALLFHLGVLLSSQGRRGVAITTQALSAHSAQLAEVTPFS